MKRAAVYISEIWSKSTNKRRYGTFKHTHRSVLGVLSLVGVVVQSDEVEARLHLVAALSEHVLPAHTLS